jgi:creatinine amidohydrolase
MLPKRHWMEMTWTDLAAADTRRWIAVLPVAAVEQHGPHLPLGVDAYIAEAYLSRVHELLPDDLPATFLPVLKIGQSDEHIAFPGTLSLSAQTVIDTYTQIGESLLRAGLRKLVIVTSHGGNVSAMELVARDLRVRCRMLVATAAWHRFGYPEGAFERSEQRHGIHAGGVETALMLADRADTVRMECAANAVAATVGMADDFKWLSAFRPVGFGWMSQDLHPSGALGDATLATAAQGEAALRHGARGFVELLGDVDRFDLARLAAGPLDAQAEGRPLQAGD